MFLRQRKWLIVLVVTLTIFALVPVISSACSPKTIGFWGNKNGEQVIGRILYVWDTLGWSMALKDGNGNDFDPKNFEQLKAWLRGANATNMKYMLSAQLAAANLNGLSFFVSYSTKIKVDPLISPSGIITLAGLVSKANTALIELDAVKDRGILEIYKNALDNFNNNLNIVP